LRTIEASLLKALYFSLFRRLGGERSEGMVNREVNAARGEHCNSHQPTLVAVYCMQQTIRHPEILGAHGVYRTECASHDEFERHLGVGL
jgi:hypothetical protein